MSFATYKEWAEALDDCAAENPLWALRSMAKYLSAYRLDLCAIAEPAAAMVHAWDFLSSERQALCVEAVRATDLARYVPDRLAQERKALELVRGFGTWAPSRSPPASDRPPADTTAPERICNGCGAPMPEGRAGRQWCSSACRQRAYRRRREGRS